MKLKFKFIKTDSGEIVINQNQKLARKLHKLKPGFYTAVIETTSSRLESMKRYYFSMESHLANHLGMSKREFHESLKYSDALARDTTDGRFIYQSIADITDAETMMIRIIELQAWASREHKYTFEPYNEETHEEFHAGSATGLQTDPEPRTEDQTLENGYLK